VRAGEWEARQGSFVFLPRGVVHAFVVTSKTAARAWQLTTPAGFEKFAADVGRPAAQPGLPASAPPDIAALRAAAERHGHEIVGPPIGHYREDET
jgi:hypothetical protein